MCADYKCHLNEKIKSDSYPIRNIETIYSKLKKAKTFAKIDLTSAYWQIELDNEAKDVSVINTTKWLYQVKRLQRGMKNSSSTFQRTMENILGDIKGIITESINEEEEVEIINSQNAQLACENLKLTDEEIVGRRISSRNHLPPKRFGFEEN